MEIEIGSVQADQNELDQCTVVIDTLLIRTVIINAYKKENLKNSDKKVRGGVI